MAEGGARLDLTLSGVDYGFAQAQEAFNLVALSGLISQKNITKVVKKVTLARSPVIMLLRPRPNPVKHERVIKVFQSLNRACQRFLTSKQ